MENRSIEEKLEVIRQSIVTNNAPYFKVFYQEHEYGSASSLLSHNDGTDHKDNPTPVEAFDVLNASIRNHLKISNKKLFKIQLRTSKKAGNGIINHDLDLRDSATQATPGPSASLAGMPMDMNSFSEQMLGAIKAERSLMEPRLELERSIAKLERERDRFEFERSQWEKEKAELQEDLVDLKKTYESRASSAKVGAERAFEAILGMITETGGKVKGGGLGRTEVEIETPEATAEQTVEDQMIESFASELSAKASSGILSRKHLSKCILTSIKMARFYSGEFDPSESEDEGENEETLSETEIENTED